MFRRLSAAVLTICLFFVSQARAAEDKFFDSKGVKIHYIVEGSGEPVILIHGFTANVLVQWELPGVVSKLKNDYQVIALDNRGHGKSDKPRDPDQYGPEMVNDVLRLMDHLKIPKAHIVGYSMGGFMTSYLLNNHPDRVISATLGGAGWAKADNAPARLFENTVADSLEQGKGVAPLIELFTPPDQPKPTKEQIQGINSMLMLTNDPKALAACMRSMKNLAVTETQLRANKVPALALIGSADPLKAGVDDLKGVMPNLKVVVLEGANHMTAFAVPKFAEELKSFLREYAKAESKSPVGAAK